MSTVWEILATIRGAIEAYPLPAYLILIGITVLVSPLLRLIVGRVALRLAIYTKIVADDLMVDALRPFRFVYALPVALGFFLAPMVAPYTYEARLVSGLLFITLVVDTVIKVLSGIGAVARQRFGGTRVNIAAYVDLLKIGAVILGITVAVTITTETEFWKLLSGFGAFTALLMFIFKDTLLSIIASLQIASWDHIREGDWISVPNFGADGTVTRIGLYDIRVKNWDLSTICIPTHVALGAGCKNYRSMSEARARRIKRALNIDLRTIQFCDRKLLLKLGRITLISDLVAEKVKALGKVDHSQLDSSSDAEAVTNLELFRAYVERYLRSRTDLHQKRMFIVVRDLAPTEYGLPLEIWAFTRNTDWADYEAVQASIFSHLIGMIGSFDLRLYQSLSEQQPALKKASAITKKRVN